MFIISIALISNNILAQIDVCRFLFSSSVLSIPMHLTQPVIYHHICSTSTIVIYPRRYLSLIDQSAKTRMPAPSTTSSQPSTSRMDQSQPPTIATQEAPMSSLPVEESQTRIDQLAGPTSPNRFSGRPRTPRTLETAKTSRKTSSQGTHRAPRRTESKGTKQDRTASSKEKGQRLS